MSSRILACAQLAGLAAMALIAPPNSGPALLAGGTATGATLLLSYLVRHRAGRYLVSLGIVLGSLPIVTCVALGIAFTGATALAVGSLGMVPLGFALFIPLDRRAHTLWLVLANAALFATLGLIGRGSSLFDTLPTLAIVMLVSSTLSSLANEAVVRRRRQMNEQMLAVRRLYSTMREREIDLRRQDEFLLMQQETLVVQQAELLRLNEELETIARLDALTGLGNRLRLNEDLAQLAGRIERSGGCAGLLLLDLDRFKRLNDTAGHLAGDEALRGVADVLRHTARVGDGLYRYGGEEFLVVLHDADEAVLELAGQRYISAIQAAAMPHAENAPWGVVTASAGASELSQRSGIDVDAALRAADEALYQAKARGRNRLEVHASLHEEPQVVAMDQQLAAS